MNPQDPLANLHPLREPELIGWWPLAPGWWLLLVTVLLCLATLAYIVLKRYRSNAYRRRALLQLQTLREQYAADQDSSRYIAGINALLKSVALVAYPRREVAANSGQEWLSFLNRSMGADNQFREDFATAAYQRECPGIDIESLYQLANRWIKQHEVAQ